jgi:hypothetical protein
MSAWTDLRDGILDVIRMQERVERLSAQSDRIAGQLSDHDRRLVRIETLIELAGRGRLRRD